MKLARFFLIGVFFGIVLTKAEAVSWYRIYEMFHFQSFHMYGIIGTALFTGIIGIQLIKKKKLKEKIVAETLTWSKNFDPSRHLIKQIRRT